MNKVQLKCHKCHRGFQVLEDERFDHVCPHCGPEFTFWGEDAMGSEINVGDDIVKSPYGEIVLEENLKDYLVEKLGFVFSKAE